MIFSDRYPVAARLQYSVFILDIPSMNRKHRLSAARIMLSGKYPGDTGSAQLRLFRNGKKKNSWICLVTAAGTAVRTSVFPTLYMANRLKHFSGFACFDGTGFIEVVKMEKGAVLLSHAAGQVPGRTGAESCAALCPEGTSVRKMFSAENGYIRGRRGDLLAAEGRRERVLRFAVPAALFLCLSGAVVPAAASYLADMKREAAGRQEAAEALRQKKIAVQKEQERLETLRKQYTDLMQVKTAGAYTVLSLIYSCLGQDALIENVSVAGNSFELDLHTQNALPVLSRFEKSGAVEQVRMSRAVSEPDGQPFREFATFSGTIRRHTGYADSSLPAEQQSAFYEREIEAENASRDRLQKKDVSTFVTEIRSLADAAGCREAYVQYLQQGDFIELEFSLRAESTRIFRFLKKASEYTPPFLFTAVRIKNSDGKDGISAVVRIYTGIPADKSEVKEPFTQRTVVQAAPEALGSRFYVFRQAVAETKPAPAAAAVKKAAVRQAPFLQYIGTGKTSTSGAYVFFRDTKKNSMLRLPVLSGVQNGFPAGQDYCIITDSLRMEVHLGNDIYEVRK